MIDDDYYMRKVIRSLLLAVGIKDVHEAANGVDGLEAIPQIVPDIVVLDWEMPSMTGSEFMRMLRSPGTVRASGRAHHHADRPCRARARGRGDPPRRQRVSLQAGFGEALNQRIMSIRGNPRPMVRIGEYYGPEPRKVKANARNVADPYEPVWV